MKVASCVVKEETSPPSARASDDTELPVDPNSVGVRNSRINVLPAVSVPAVSRQRKPESLKLVEIAEMSNLEFCANGTTKRVDV